MEEMENMRTSPPYILTYLVMFGTQKMSEVLFQKRK